MILKQKNFLKVYSQTLYSRGFLNYRTIGMNVIHRNSFALKHKVYQLPVNVISIIKTEDSASEEITNVYNVSQPLVLLSIDVMIVSGLEAIILNKTFNN